MVCQGFSINSGENMVKYNLVEILIYDMRINWRSIYGNT